jgi:tetratricopeptide (TPR) repeat protein
MERAGAFLMILMQGLQANSNNQVIDSWHFANQKAAQTRIKMAHGNKDQLHLFDTDFYNLRTSINWLAEQDDFGSAELLLEYLDTLFPFLRQKRHFHELDKWCTAGLRACEIVRRSPAGVLLMKTETQFALGRWKEAQATVEQVLADRTGLDSSVSAQALFVLGRIQIEVGEYKAALATLERAENLYAEQGDIGKIIEIRSEVGAYYLNRRDLDKALALFLAANELHQTSGVMQAFDHTQMMIGVVYRHKRQYGKAIEYFGKLYASGKAAASQPAAATAAYHISWALLEQGDLVGARRMCGEAIAGYQELLDTRGLSDAYEQLAAILTEEGQLDDAEDYLDRCIDMRKLIGNQPGLVSSFRRLALVRLLTRDYWGTLRLIWVILISYLQMNMFSRQRIFKLAKDAMVGIGKAVLLGNKSQSHDKKQSVSVMERFFRGLVGRR